VKFTPEGGRVELSLSRAGDEAVVRVRDTGTGIAAGEQEPVTRRFYRSDKILDAIHRLPRFALK
jgi:signal transduction histidine kinase